MTKYAATGVYKTHEDLLCFEGKSTNNSFNAILYSMGAILMAIIMVGAISLIYSAFSISLSERTKQMGLLKSIGATKKQIRHSVVFEACVLCMVGIPLGIAAGLGGIGITLHGISGLLLKLWSGDTPLPDPSCCDMAGDCDCGYCQLYYRADLSDDPGCKSGAHSCDSGDPPE